MWTLLFGLLAWADPGPAASQASFDILVGSCNDQDRPMPHWAQLATHRPELVILTGDNVYGDLILGPDGKLTGFQGSEERLRQAYARLGADPGFQALRAAAPVLATWDDHDYGLNDSGAELPFRQASQELFRDFWRPGVPPSAAEGVYAESWAAAGGLKIQVLLLDVRSFRSPLAKLPEGAPQPLGPYRPTADPQATMLGAAQWAWLEERLRQPADLRLVVSGTQVLAEGHAYERWGNFPAERQRLLDTLQRTRANGVIFLSGDRHLGELLREDQGGPYPLYELSSSSLNKSFGTREPEPHRLRVGAQVYEENHGWITVDPVGRTVRLALRAHDGTERLGELLRLSDLQP